MGHRAGEVGDPSRVTCRRLSFVKRREEDLDSPAAGLGWSQGSVGRVDGRIRTPVHTHSPPTVDSKGRRKPLSHAQWMSGSGDTCCTTDELSVKDGHGECRDQNTQTWSPSPKA